jgi:hypothetical protein
VAGEAQGRQRVSVPPESIETGRCYPDARYRVLHVTPVTRDGRVRFKHQEAHPAMVDAWWPGMTSLREFASQAVREVPRGWRPGTDGA